MPCGLTQAMWLIRRTWSPAFDGPRKRAVTNSKTPTNEHQMRQSTAQPLPHLVRCLDAEQSEPGGEDGNNAFDQCQARCRYLWIILYNEA